MSLMQPSRSKFRKDRKHNKGKIAPITFSGDMLDKGGFGLKALSSGRVTSAQIEATRRVLRRTMKKSGKVFIRIFPNNPITKKPAEVRMGGGKGSPEYWCSIVEPGRIMFEVEGVDESLAREALGQAAYKLPVKTMFVRRVL